MYIASIHHSKLFKKKIKFEKLAHQFPRKKKKLPHKISARLNKLIYAFLAYNLSKNIIFNLK